MITQLDYKIVNFIQQNLRTELGDTIWAAITNLGDGGFIWVSFALILLFTKKHRKAGFLMLVALIVGVLLGEQIIKPLIGRVRPCNLNPEIQLAIPRPHGYSFPSSHSWSSFTAATILFLHNRKWGWGAMGTASAIAFSRVYLYVHFPTDILAGGLFGVGMGFLVWIMAGKIQPLNRL